MFVDKKNGCVIYLFSIVKFFINLKVEFGCSNVVVVFSFCFLTVKSQ